MNKKLDWQELHLEVTALNRDIQVAGETVMIRVKRIRQILESIPSIPQKVEPEMVEVLRVLLAIIESKFDMKNLITEGTAAQNITTLISMKNLEMAEPKQAEVADTDNKKQEMPPEILY